MFYIALVRLFEDEQLMCLFLRRDLSDFERNVDWGLLKG